MLRFRINERALAVAQVFIRPSSDSNNKYGDVDICPIIKANIAAIRRLEKRGDQTSLDNADWFKERFRDICKRYEDELIGAGVAYMEEK